ncbi:tRNA(Glu)-specific nuclease WapA [bacterium HR15]|nr:tRNA(Glu)-specific nuclease WapA [bacterium HR15]
MAGSWLGHVRALVGRVGNSWQVTDTYAYDSWGNLIAHTGTTQQPFTWNGAYGYEYIPATGLYHVGAREYDPRTARWLQRDPIDAASGDPNLYRYCGNDPLSYQDQDGMSSQKRRWGRKDCENLARKIRNLIRSLEKRISKYNPAEDAKGGHPYTDRKTGQTCYTKPYEHYRKISEELNALQRRLQAWYDHCDDPENNDIRPDISKANELLQWDQPIPYPGYTGWIPPALGGGFYEPGLIDLTPIWGVGAAGIHLAAGSGGATVTTTTAASAASATSWGERIAAAIGAAARMLQDALKTLNPAR